MNETWAQLEPREGAENWADLDTSLAAVTAYNASHQSTQLGVKLRIFGGRTAPDWAKALGGVALSGIAAAGAGVTVGRWWTPDYRTAWSAFEHALAARYDGNALIREVAVTSCASLTGEPFITPVGPATLPALTGAGWTSALQADCLQGAFSDYSGWRHTWIDYPFNTFRSVNGAVAHDDFSVTQAVMATCAQWQTEGSEPCILGNHGLQDSLKAAATPVYAEVNTLWASTPGHVGVYFQTYGPNSGDSCTSVATAGAHHARSVEVWPPRGNLQGFAAIPLKMLLAWNAALISQQRPNC